MIFGRRICRFGIARPGAAIQLPALAAAVHDPAILVAVELEHPECVAGPPVVLVAVEHDGRVVGDAFGAAEFGESILADVVAHERILQVGMPIDLHRAGHVPLLIEQHVFVRLDDADVGILPCSSTHWVETSTSG